ncbi:hypothetical protein CPC08DRAFT_716240 [Agrocybe pediades]|nr:hypothetical protein CPC08DRAFT_716240 [Agrocybe pediades]
MQRRQKKHEVETIISCLWGLPLFHQDILRPPYSCKICAASSIFETRRCVRPNRES